MFQSLFQSFDEIADPTLGAGRVKALRAELARRGLRGFVVPRADAHQNEYVPASEERLRPMDTSSKLSTPPMWSTFSNWRAKPSDK